MAYKLEYWADDNSIGQIQLKSVRLHSIEEAYPLSLEHNRPKDCVMVTVRRTDKQSPNEKLIWIKPGYVDPCLLGSEDI